MTPADLSQVVGDLIAEHGVGGEALVPLLLGLQESCGYLPEEALKELGARAGLPPAQVWGVVTFYDRFRTRPAGRHRVQVCVGTACHVKGADRVLAAFREHLYLRDGEDTDDAGLFTVEQVACLGCCTLAPAVRIDDVTYGPLQPAGVAQVLAEFLRSLQLVEPRHQPGGGGTATGELRVCLCSACSAAGAREVHRALTAAVADRDLPATVRSVSCTGLSHLAPLVDVAMQSEGQAGGPRGFRYARVQPDHARALAARHFPPPGAARRLGLAAETLLDRLLGLLSGDGQAVPPEPEPLLRYPAEVRDHRGAAAATPLLALEGAGELDPLDLDAYTAAGGFQALRAALQTAGEDLVSLVEASGLRGRGGAGYPAGAKWRSVREAPGDTRYLVVNGDEGDPGAFMDRMLLESFPLRVLEGAAIAALAVGAEDGWLYVRGEYPLALERLRRALARCEQAGYLGSNILGSGRSVRLRVAEGAGAFVCGEESALLAALEGRRPTPRHRPPYPAEQGLRGSPTLVNNVETLALVPWILRHGPQAFAALGSPGSPGTKTFALAGCVQRGGLVEVPMGLSLAQLVDDLGGGPDPGRTVKAVHVGGPAGGCVPAAHLDTPVDYEALREQGAIMGSGGLVVLDDRVCLVDFARYLIEFACHQSCGTCTFCRVGTRRLLERLEDLCAGRGAGVDLDQLQDLARWVGRGSLCGLGRSAPNVLLSTLRHFRQEYAAHVAGRCPARRCRSLLHYRITEACIGCTRCAQVCPSGAIQARPYQPHSVEDARCTRCDACRVACPVDAVEVE